MPDNRYGGGRQRRPAPCDGCHAAYTEPIRGNDMKMRMNQNGSAAFSAHRSAPSALSTLLGDAGNMLNLWRWRRHERRTIRHLDDHMLRDIGLDRVTAESIGARPFWKA